MQARIWFRLGVGLLALAAVGAAFFIVMPRVQPLPIYWALPDATLVDQDGRPFSLSQTRGKVVVVSMIYTYCPDICPLTTSRMKQIQERVKAGGLADQVTLVTFTIDPERDRPEILTQYARVRQADLANWVFLTGEPAQIQELTKQLKVYTERVYMVNGTRVVETATTPPLPTNTVYLVNHTDRLFLVDRQGNVRALPPGSRTDVGEAMQLIRQLVGEPSS